MAKRFGLNPRTIRYYEATGVLQRAQRTESGYRIYSEEDFDRLEFVLRAKSLGLMLPDLLSSPLLWCK